MTGKKTAVAIKNRAKVTHRGVRAHIPIYERLFENYRDDIFSRKILPGDRIDSITELQSKHRVSRETAKKVLEMLAKEGLILQKAGKGSFVNDLSPKKKIWGVILPLYSLQYEELLKQIINMAASNDREVRHFCAYNNWKEEIRLVGTMLAEKYDKILIVPTQYEELTKSFYKRVSATERNIVLVDHAKPNNPFSCSVQNYQLGVEQAMKYLLDKNNGRVAYIKNSTWGERNLVQKLMEERYSRYLKENGCGIKPLVLCQGERLPGKLLKSEGVTGLLCEDDICAIQCLGSLKDQGMSVPGDFNLVSYGNTDLAEYFTPAITSIDPHRQKVADGILKIFANESDVIQFFIEPELIVRET